MTAPCLPVLPGVKSFIYGMPILERCCAPPVIRCCLYNFSPDDQQIALFQDGPQIGIYEIIRSETFRYTVRGGYRNDGNSLLNAAFTRMERY